ncbi:MAG: xanthine dehydrogenase family protein subunit M [Anaerolineales bacterium]|nr:MAG: xanthine dehydrogenase family protein subunit M [Anaerolineales bacterium]
MKPAPFKYYAPSSVPEVLALLKEYGYDAKILAGGQSLVPMMNFRLVQPAVLVDINNIPELATIKSDQKGVQLGAMVRHSQAEKDPLIKKLAPLIHESMPHIATTQIRNRGTVGGSLAHADPSAELVVVTTALEAQFKIQNQKGERVVPAKDFFVGLLVTVMEPEDLLVEIEIPALQPHTGWSLKEVARRQHDFSLMGVAAIITLDKKDRCQEARLVYLSAGDGPISALEAAGMMVGEEITPELITAVAEKAAADEIDPGSDIHATADFRRHLANVLTRRALEEANQRAKGGK